MSQRAHAQRRGGIQTRSCSLCCARLQRPTPCTSQVRSCTSAPASRPGLTPARFVLCLLSSASPGHLHRTAQPGDLGSPLSETVIRILPPPLLRSRALTPAVPVLSFATSHLEDSVPARGHVLLSHTPCRRTGRSRIKPIHTVPLLNPVVAGLQGRGWRTGPSSAPLTSSLTACLPVARFIPGRRCHLSLQLSLLCQKQPLLYQGCPGRLQRGFSDLPTFGWCSQCIPLLIA